MDTAALLLYLVVSSITPGPNNLMSLYLGANDGLRRSRRFLYGSTAGFAAKALICGLLNMALASAVPTAVPYLKWLGVAYMLYLAFCMLRGGFREEKTDGVRGGEATFAAGILLQVLNVKSWISCLSMYSVYVIGHTTAPAVMLAVALAATVLIGGSALCWMCFGSAFQAVYRAHRRVFSVVLALSLVLCAITALR